MTPWRGISSVAILGAVLLSTACAHKRPIQTQIIIPHECITTDIRCTPGKKEMRCNFDKFVGCEIVKVGAKPSKEEIGGKAPN